MHSKKNRSKTFANREQNQSNCKLQDYYKSTKTKLNLIYCNHMFQSHSILNPTFPTPSTFPC